MTERDPDLWPHILSKLAAHEALTADEAAEAMQEVMAGEATPAQLGGLLMALRTKGETVDEVDGLARTMLAFANPVTPPAPVIDTCGTGGDRTGTFNISTISAIVVAGAGVPVAKHGKWAASPTNACCPSWLRFSLGGARGRSCSAVPTASTSSLRPALRRSSRSTPGP